MCPLVTRPSGRFPLNNSSRAETLIPVQLRYKYRHCGPIFRRSFRAGEIPEAKIHVIFKADVDKDGRVIAGTSKKATQQNDKTELTHDASTAFEHAQHHHPHKRPIQEKRVFHHAKEPGLEKEEHDKKSIENERLSEKDGQIHVKLTDRLRRDEGTEKESYSGDESSVEVKDVHFPILRSDPHGEKKLEKRKIDPEDGEHEFSGEHSDMEELHVPGKDSRQPIDDEDTRTEWKHFQMHLQSQKKNRDEFGYITNEEEDDDSEEHDDESLSGQRDYDHAHIKTLHVHHRTKHVKHARDSPVTGKIVGEEDEEVEDGHSGEGRGLNSVYERRDLQTIERDDETEDHEGSLNFEDDEDVGNLSGAEGLSTRIEDKILEEGYENTVLHAEESRKEVVKPGKKEIPEENKGEPDRQIKNTRKGNKLGIKTKIPKSKNKGPSVNNQISHQSHKLKVHAEIDLTHKKNDIIPKEKTSKNPKAAIARKNPKIRDVESQTGAESDLNNVEDFYIDESDNPKEKIFAVEMQEVKDKDYAENTNPGHQKINKREQTEYGNAEGGQNFRRGNSRHLLQFMNLSDPFNALPGQLHFWY